MVRLGGLIADAGPVPPAPVCSAPKESSPDVEIDYWETNENAGGFESDFENLFTYS
jgi:hypothetical protein